MVERTIQWRYVGIALVLTAVMFMGVLLIGQELSNYKVNELESQITQLETEQRSTSMTRRLADELGGQDCSAQRIVSSQNLDDLYEVRQQVVQYQQSRKISNPRFEDLKRKYILATLEHYVRQKKIEQTCNDTKVEVLYFHRDDCESCEGQGKMLTKFREIYDNQMLVYPLDSDYELEPVEFLESYYGIEEYPAIVVEDKVYNGFVSRSELSSEIERRINTTNSTGGQ